MSPSEQAYQPAAAARDAGGSGLAGGVMTEANRPPMTMPRGTASHPTDPAGAESDAAATTGARKVRLALAKVDPWSVLKLSFLLSVAMGIAMVVAAIILWSLLKSMGVFEQVNSLLKEMGGSTSTFDIYNYVGLGQVISFSTFIGVVNILLVMALATLGAFLYNISATLVGGLHVTLSDD